MAKDELHPWTKWIVGALVVLTILVLAYQRAQRSDHVEPVMRANEPPDLPPAPGQLEVSPQKKGVRTQKPVVLQKEKRDPSSVPPPKR